MSVKEVAELAATIADHVQDILLGSNTEKKSVLFDPEACLSDERMFEVAKYVFRDLQRLEHDQGGQVAISKIVGYTAFWFSKLKPLNSVFVVEKDGPQVENEFCGINEAVAVVLLERLFWDLVCVNKDLYPSVWENCNRTGCVFAINGTNVQGKCFNQKLRGYLKEFEGKHRNYLEYCLRYRAVSPYFLVNYIDEALFMSCEHFSPNVTDLAGE